MKKTSIIFLLLIISLAVSSCQSVDITPVVELPSPSPVDTEMSEPESTETLTPLPPTPPSFMFYPASVAFPAATPEGVFFYEYSPDENWIVFHTRYCAEYQDPCLILENIQTGVRWQLEFEFRELRIYKALSEIGYWNLDQEYLIYYLLNDPYGVFSVNRLDLVTGETQEIVFAEHPHNINIIINQSTGEMFYLLRRSPEFAIYHLDSNGVFIESLVFPEFDKIPGLSNLVFLDEYTKFVFYIAYFDPPSTTLVMVDLSENAYSVARNISIDYDAISPFYPGYVDIFYKDGAWTFVPKYGETTTITPDHIETYDLQITHP